MREFPVKNEKEGVPMKIVTFGEIMMRLNPKG